MGAEVHVWAESSFRVSGGKVGAPILADLGVVTGAVTLSAG